MYEKISGCSLSGSYTFFTSTLKPDEPFFGPVTIVELNGKMGTGTPLSPVSSQHAGFSVKGEGIHFILP